jgi:hypothetical protein
MIKKDNMNSLLMCTLHSPFSETAKIKKTLELKKYNHNYFKKRALMVFTLPVEYSYKKTP